MKIRTFYWHDRVVSRFGLKARRALGMSAERFFLVGNAGDILADQLLRWQYDCDTINVRRGGHRLLLVGSIGHRIQSGDIACGIGVKSHDIPKANKVKIQVVGLRGPMSYDIFKRAGHDVSEVKFLLDPGLLMRFLGDEIQEPSKPQGSIFIPHYRERDLYRHNLQNGIRFVDIDDKPLNVARAILSSELVFSSSLHGVIFAHALNRPCVVVKPQTGEPTLKYEDYFLSIGRDMPPMLRDISEVNFFSCPNSPLTLTYQLSDFAFPKKELLFSARIAV
ncbi:MAG: pyruvyl transferase [Congregibacter sp.]|jgi:pyruvyltransferase